MIYWRRRLSNQADFRANVKRALSVAELWIQISGAKMSDYLPSSEAAAKRRDKREPKRREKELAEDELAGIIGRLFRAQKKQITDRLTWRFPERKAADDWGDDLDPDEYDDIMAELVIRLKKSALSGIDIAVASLPMLDPDPTAARAAKWAVNYAYSLIRDVNQTTIEAIRSAITAFTQTPGMTIGDMVDMIPLSPDRALRIAVTETTRAYAEGQRMAGVEMRDQFPDVQVYKEWFTNNDDLVCEICAPLDGMVVKFEEYFTTEDDKSIGLDGPAAHPNCRCWMNVYTDITKDA